MLNARKNDWNLSFLDMRLSLPSSPPTKASGDFSTIHGFPAAV
jgi:hypothetical protein